MALVVYPKYNETNDERTLVKSEDIIHEFSEHGEIKSYKVDDKNRITLQFTLVKDAENAYATLKDHYKVRWFSNRFGKSKDIQIVRLEERIAQLERTFEFLKKEVSLLRMKE